MTTTAESYSVKHSGAKAPVSAHPAFPAIVALWFATLLGLGSLVLPVALIERLVAVTGVASLVPSAAPPLGFTARVSIALGGAIAGALIGLALAHRVARTHSRDGEPRRFFEASEMLISADEPGENGPETGPGMEARPESGPEATEDAGFEAEAREPTPDASDPLPCATPSLHQDEPADAGNEVSGESAAPQLSIIETPARAEEPQDGCPLDELGLVQLATRLGASLEKRKAQLAARRPAFPATLPPLAGADPLETAEAEDAARAIADFFGSPEAAASLAKTAASGPASDIPASPPPASVSNHTEYGVENSSPEFDRYDTDDDDEYGSLLAMKNPFARQQEFVRAEEPEDSSVTEPAAPRDPADAERRLRDALATLQRMSGAA